MTDKKIQLNSKKKTFQQMSTWVNNTNDTFRFELMTNEPLRNGKAIDYVRDEVEIKSGESYEIPSIFDAAIRQIDKYGRVVGGLCPMLTKVGEEDVEVEACLDYRIIMEEEKLAVLSKKIEKEKAFQEARTRLAEAEIKAKEIKKAAGRPKAE